MPDADVQSIIVRFARRSHWIASRAGQTAKPDP
jgi:hypothetical protein